MRDLKAEIERCKKKLAGLEEELKNQEEFLGFKNGDIVYKPYVSVIGEVVTDPIVLDFEGEGHHRELIEYGSVFHNVEEAMFESACDRVTTELRYLSEKSGEKENEWDGDNEHWYVCFDICYESLRVGHTQTRICSDIYFATEQSAWDAIEKIGQERIKKYYLRQYGICFN